MNAKLLDLNQNILYTKYDKYVKRSKPWKVLRQKGGINETCFFLLLFLWNMAKLND